MKTGGAGMRGVGAAGIYSAGRGGAVISPTYIGFTGTLGEQRKKNCSQRAEAGRAGCMADGLRGHGEEDCGEPDPLRDFLFSPQSHRKSMGEGEIEKAMEVYARHDCIVISDEIWSDLVLPGGKHIPTQSVSEDARNRTIAVYAPSKTFNLAGLVGSYDVIYNTCLRDRVEKVSGMSHYNTPSVLSVHALIGAYKPEGRVWVDELCQVLGGNVDYAYDYITEHFKGVSLAKPQGTYMLYLDCEQWCREHAKTMDELLVPA